MTNAFIEAGVCGFRTEVAADAPDGQNVKLSVTTDCDNIRDLVSQLGEIDAYAELGAGWEGVIQRVARATLKGCCSGCVVPGGLFKAMQVEANMALPQTVSVRIEKQR
ncbi:MAG: hypothetical protein COZ06_32100 [Armatimonadetes bacterium CG_4_10_14_3_um_filter_66_18]|nr:hypothetical protein [Armatimonadota bacterium]OIP11037.1 MAG: hypothetical protein AUJ96_03050 [Armatimonadetes bacterium CG2_30_66_41]PIU89993.1 MAG: hypothetical protein COS65_26625 [Armatimonadetes bacterium CG06_land_8_20_14_3_00_66_21]PIX49992.1 MAG: hypothetical protein COZ57_01205 [Armatimonadetes bacterium CG_4_8_14_3_um_filter_66_20]PIY37833.1 MAG: hypothetical protein COZ06_32100 [Armatimonadetes bacterium CG_4_10_14_3_um_filter_66_18]PIZ43998.1 MAG: hypothetical protein COY42_14